MSWSIAAMGKGGALAIKAAEDLNRYKCVEPEETIKGKVLDIIVTACHAAPNQGFILEASGHQYTHDGDILNSVTLKMNPIQLAE